MNSKRFLNLIELSKKEIADMQNGCMWGNDGDRICKCGCNFRNDDGYSTK